MRKYSDLRTRFSLSSGISGYVVIFVYCLSILLLSNSGISQSTPLLVLIAAMPSLFLLYFRYKESREYRLTDIKKYEITLLSLVVVESLLNSLSSHFFLSYFLLLPVIYIYLGLYSSLIALVCLTVFRLGSLSDYTPQIITLIALTYLLGTLTVRKVRDIPLNIYDYADGSPPYRLSNEDIEITESRNTVKSSVQLMEKLIPHNSIIIYLRDENGLFCLEEYISGNPGNIDSGQKISIRNNSYINLAMRMKSSVIIDNIKNHSANFQYYSKQTPVDAVMITPVLPHPQSHETDPLGFILVDSATGNPFTGEHKLITEITAERIASELVISELGILIRRSKQRTDTLYEFIRELGDCKDEDIIMGHLSETLGSIFRNELICITRLIPREKHSILKNSTADTGPLSGKEFGNRNSLIGIVSETGKTLNFHDIADKSKHRTVFDKEIDLSLGIGDIKSATILPLSESQHDYKAEKNNSRILGAVFIGRTTYRKYGQEEIKLTNILIQEAARAIRLSQNLDRIKELAVKDGLSGLYNQRYFLELLGNTVARSLRFPEEFSLMLIDIDDFKKINDEYGHQTGDDVIRRTGELINSSLRDTDIPSRYGGDEFAVVLPNTDEAGSIMVAGKIRQRIKNLVFKPQDGDLRLTISIGITTFPKNGMTRDSLVRNADSALYEAKTSGKDRHVHYNDVNNISRTDGNSALIQ